MNIKTWQERMGLNIHIEGSYMVDARQAEIDELRARVAELEAHNAMLLATSKHMREKLAALEKQEPVAHIYPSDLAKFQTAETFAYCYSVAVGCPDEHSVPLYLAAKETK